MRIIGYVLIAFGLGYLALSANGLGSILSLPVGAMCLGMIQFMAVPLASFLLAGIIFLSKPIPRFMATFIDTLAVAHLLLVSLLLVQKFDAVPFGLEDYVPPASMAVAVSITSALIYACSFIPVIRTILAIGDRFYQAPEQGSFSLGPFGTLKMREGTIGSALLALIIAINLFQVAVSVRLNFFSRDLFNALQDKDGSAFWYQLIVIFLPIALIFIFSALGELLVSYFLQIRWREYLNKHYVENWLKGGLHYEMQLVGGETDNPDQRIADDLRNYVEMTYDLSIKLLGQVATLVSFISILWSLSVGFTLPGTDIPIPGLLVWVAILYAALGTWLIHLIGRPLIGLFFKKERVEADYRFSLARVREYSEQIALLKGQEAEAERLHGRFGAIVANYLDIAWRRTKILTFSASFMQVNAVFPYILTAPYYFIGRITLGQMQQTVGAFSRVQEAFNFFINAYTMLAGYKAVVDRLTSFEQAMQRAGDDHKSHRTTSISEEKIQEIILDDVTVRLPNGQILMEAVNLDFRKGEATLFTGPSGAGKSTLFRAIAGVWPFGEGKVVLPNGETVLELPQRPYVPQGTLRDAVTYPALVGTYSDPEIIAALEGAKLGQFAHALDDERLWSQTLSLGEQQRLAVARALLTKPDWLLLDEATAALDEATEAEIYLALKRHLPKTTLISIGHRSTLLAFHDRRIDVQKGEAGQLVWRDTLIKEQQG